MSVVTFAGGKGVFRTWRGVLEVQEPLVHLSDERQGEGEDTFTPVRRLAFAAGSKVPVPVVSANAIRGILRRLISIDLLNRVELTVNDIGPRVVYLLTSGGGLEGKDKRRSRQDNSGEPPSSPEPPLHIGSKSKVLEHLPVIGLFGASFLNAMVEGSARISHAIPICNITAKFLGREDDPAASMMVKDLTDVTYQTRKDDRLKEEALDRGAAQQQIFRYEYIAPGVRLHHSMAVEAATDLQVSCLAHGMALFRQRPVLGGKWSGGFGRVGVDYEEIGDPNLYLAWVDKHKAEVRDYLAGLEPARKAE